MRVQIPAYTDRWMMGDRYGEVIKTKTHHKGVRMLVSYHYVKLDKSGKTIKVSADDCTEV